jgi:small subunit ribosomal protein S21
LQITITFAPVKTISMLKIPVKEGENIERAIKKFKKKFERTGTLKELRERQKYTKPSIINRQTRLRAVYRNLMQEKLG